MSIEVMKQALEALSGKIIVYSKEWRERRKAAIEQAKKARGV